MKYIDQEAHLQNFQLNFIGHIFSENHNKTIEDLIPNSKELSIDQSPLGHNVMRSSMESENKNNSNSKTEKKQGKAMREEKNLLRMYIFDVKLWLLEVILAYIIFIIMLLIQDKANFPAFNCILTFFLTFILQPFQKSNLFIIVLGIPINIINFYLGIGFLTSIQLIIIYFTCYLFNQYYRMSLLWTLNVVLLVSFAFLALPRIYSEFSSSYVFYFVFPLLLYVVRLVLALSHHSIKHYSQPLLQIPLFLRGLQYGVLMSVSSDTPEFWYSMILFTLQIVDQRLQFVFKFLKKLIKATDQNSRWVLTAKCSAHVCLNSFHICVLVYIIIATKLKTVIYRHSLKEYFNETAWNPLIIWVFFSLYEFIMMQKVVKREDKFIIGSQFHEIKDFLKRSICLVYGFWIFYIGLCIPHSIFF